MPLPRNQAESQLITTEPIGPAGHPVACPHCGSALFVVFADRTVYESAPIYFYGDTISIIRDLDDSQIDGYGWEATLNAGKCPNCAGPLYEIVATFMDVEPDEDVENIFFHRNGDRGEVTNFLARKGDEQWIITRCDTPQGPMLEHAFGPFRDTYGNWIELNGVPGSAPEL
jgi:hypothetical protein